MPSSRFADTGPTSLPPKITPDGGRRAEIVNEICVDVINGKGPPTPERLGQHHAKPIKAVLQSARSLAVPALLLLAQVVARHLGDVLGQHA